MLCALTLGFGDARIVSHALGLEAFEAGSFTEALRTVLLHLARPRAAQSLAGRPRGRRGSPLGKAFGTIPVQNWLTSRCSREMNACSSAFSFGYAWARGGPITAMVSPPALMAALWAAVSIPAASPLTTVIRCRTISSARRVAVRMPRAEALREPTMLQRRSSTRSSVRPDRNTSSGAYFRSHRDSSARYASWSKSGFLTASALSVVTVMARISHERILGHRISCSRAGLLGDTRSEGARDLLGCPRQGTVSTCGRCG